MYANPKDIRSERINLSLNDAEFEALKQLANKRGLQPSVLARELVLDFLKNGNSSFKLQASEAGAEIAHAEAVANRCRKLHLHLENNRRTSGDDWSLARHYEDRLGSRDGNFSHEELKDAEKLLAKHGF